MKVAGYLATYLASVSVALELALLCFFVRYAADGRMRLANASGRRPWSQFAAKTASAVGWKANIAHLADARRRHPSFAAKELT